MKIIRTRYRRLIPYILGQWPRLSLIVILTLGTAVSTALQPWPMKILVDYALGHTALPPQLSWLTGSVHPSAIVLLIFAAWASIALFAMSSLLDAGLTWMWSVTGQRLIFGLTTDLFHRLQRLSLLFHRRRTVGDSLERLSTDSWCIYSLTDALLTPFYHVAKLGTVGMVAWQLDHQLAALSFLMAPPLAASSLFFGKRLKRRARRSREAQSRVSSFVQQTLSAIPVVQAFSTEAVNKGRFQDLAENAVLVSQRGALINSGYGLVNGFVITLGMAVVLYAGAQRVLSGALSLGGLIVFLAYVRNLQSASEGLLKTYGSLKPVEAGMDRVLEILDAEEQMEDRAGARPLPVPAAAGLSIRFEEVTFGYEPDQPVLKGISLEAHAGERLALVGRTGAGKSTLVSLIPRLFDPWSGRVLFGGVDAREIGLRNLRSQVTMVLQEPFLFAASVADNIAYGRAGASREEIIAASVAANADEFVRRLPEGYDTVLGERGATLSGGERQRLSIARAVLKDAPVLILDEPTSALDASTEASLMEALGRLMKGRTTFLIAHRLSTVRDADRVLVLADGRLIETGTPEELLERDGAYRRMHSLQFATAAGGMLA